MQFKSAEENLRAFALKQNPAFVRPDLKRFVDEGSVQHDANVAAVAQALDPIPFAVETFHVIRSTEIERVTPLWVFAKPVHAAPTLDGLAPAAFAPRKPAVCILLF